MIRIILNNVSIQDRIDHFIDGDIFISKFFRRMSSEPKILANGETAYFFYHGSDDLHFLSQTGAELVTDQAVRDRIVFCVIFQ